MISPVFPAIERLLDQQDRTGWIFSDPLQISNGLASTKIRSCIEKIQKKYIITCSHSLEVLFVFSLPTHV
jgi:hypothetical protein